VYDESNNLLLEILNNEWKTGDILPWDIKADYQLLVIQNKPKNIVFEVDARNNPIKITANLWKNRANIQINENLLSVFIDGSMILESCGATFINCYFSIDTINKCFTLA